MKLEGPPKGKGLETQPFLSNHQKQKNRAAVVLFLLEANKLQSSHKCVKPFGMARSLVFTGTRCREDSLLHPHLGGPLAAKRHCLQRCACTGWGGDGSTTVGG